MRKSILAISILFFSIDAFALVASDIDMAPAVADISLVVSSVVSFLVFLMGYKKILVLLGR